MFLLSLLGLAGVYIDTGLLLVAFTLLQLALIYKSGAGEDANAHAAIPTESRWLVVLFFCSGFAALIYQMVWQRALFQAFGVNIESVTIIVSIFMFGLGIGALAGGALSKKYPRHLPHLFVACELLIGLFGLSLIGAVTQPTIHGSLLTLSVATYGLLFVPTLFMGATLPILVSYLYRAYQNVGRSLSVLYFANTLGSALACFACAYLLFLFLGLKDSCNVAAAINFLVACAAYRFSPNHEEAEGSNPPDSVSVRQGAGVDSRYALILIVSFTVGFVSLSQEILWVRLVSFTTGGRATVFPLVLGFFLIGIVLGSLKANRLVELYKDRLLNIASAFIVASSVSYFLMIPVLARIVGVIGWASVPLMFIGVGGVAFLTGAVLPMLAHYAHVGFSISWIYFLNIVGSTAGSLLTGFFLLNWLSIEQTIFLLSASYFVFGAILWLSSRRPIDYTSKTIVGVGSLAILLFLTYQPLYSDLLERRQTHRTRPWPTLD